MDGFLGVGSEDFSAMDELDSDDALLSSGSMVLPYAYLLVKIFLASPTCI